MENERYAIWIMADHQIVRIEDTQTGEMHSFSGARALFDALGVLAEWRDRDRLQPVRWCHCQGSAPTRLHPVGVVGCAYRMPDNGHSGVRTEDGKRQFCAECKRTVDTYRSFPFGSGRVHVCDACWPVSDWNPERRNPDYVAAAGPDAIERPNDYDGDGTENSEPAAGVCGGHGAHPHDGRQCLDCPICRPSTKES